MIHDRIPNPVNLITDPIGSGLSAASDAAGSLGVPNPFDAVSDAASGAVSEVMGVVVDLAGNVVIAAAGVALVVFGVRRAFGG